MTVDDLHVFPIEALPFLGLPFTEAGLRNFRLAVRSLFEEGLTGRFIETLAATDAAAAARKIQKLTLLRNFTCDGWHPYRVARELKVPVREVSVEILACYLEIIANAPLHLRSVLVDILTGIKAQTFLKPEDLIEFQEVLPRGHYLRHA